MVGTSGYMSPEQARGLAADHRSDVFAFGCVLYECITGTQAFSAPSAVERMNQVITADPAPIAVRAPAAPADLGRVVRKCLAKDPDERYQTMKELAIDLRDVRRQLESGLTPAPVTPQVPVKNPGSGGRGPLVWVAVAGAIVFAIAAALFYQRRTTTPVTEGAAAAPRATIERLTTTGNTIDSSISADGAYLAHIEAVGRRQTLWIRDLKSGQDRLLVPEGAYAFYGVRMSPDGRDVIYSMQGSLWRQRLGTAEARQLTTGPWYDYQPDWSPDGRSVVFASYNGESIDLRVLDLERGTASTILANHAVNL
jgi:hypothetical protein